MEEEKKNHSPFFLSLCYVPYPNLVPWTDGFRFFIAPSFLRRVSINWQESFDDGCNSILTRVQAHSIEKNYST